MCLIVGCSSENQMPPKWPMVYDATTFNQDINYLLDKDQIDSTLYQRLQLLHCSMKHQNNNVYFLKGLSYYQVIHQMDNLYPTVQSTTHVSNRQYTIQLRELHNRKDSLGFNVTFKETPNTVRPISSMRLSFYMYNFLGQLTVAITNRCDGHNCLDGEQIYVAITSLKSMPHQKELQRKIIDTFGYEPFITTTNVKIKELEVVYEAGDTTTCRF